MALAKHWCHQLVQKDGHDGHAQQWRLKTATVRNAGFNWQIPTINNRNFDALPTTSYHWNIALAVKILLQIGPHSENADFSNNLSIESCNKNVAGPAELAAIKHAAAVSVWNIHGPRFATDLWCFCCWFAEVSLEMAETSTYGGDQVGTNDDDGM